MVPDCIDNPPPPKGMASNGSAHNLRPTDTLNYSLLWTTSLVTRRSINFFFYLKKKLSFTFSSNLDKPLRLC